MLKILSIFILLLLCSGLASAGDEDKINAELKAHAGGTYTLPADTYIISGQIKIPANTVFTGEVGEDGKLLSKIVLIDNADFDRQEPLILGADNTRICYLHLDGNSENQRSGIDRGDGFHNWIGYYYSINVEIDHNFIDRNLGDSVRLRSCENVDFHDNYISRSGHDELFLIECQAVKCHNNTFQPMGNSAIRMIGGYGIRIYSNTIEFSRYDADGEYIAGVGPGIQAQNDGGTMGDIEICDNYIINPFVAAFWIVGKTVNDKEDIWIHHNVITDSGEGRGWGSGGVLASGYDNILFENNVLDGSYYGAINFIPYNGAWGMKAKATIQNNIIINSVPGIKQKAGGWGINNEIPAQQADITDNYFYNNQAGDIRGFDVSEDLNYFTNPLNSKAIDGITWKGGQWAISGINPKGFGNISYPDNHNATDKDIAELEWSKYFLNGALNWEYPYNAVTYQTPETLEYSVRDKNLNESGKVAGVVKFLGWNNLTVIDNEYYVSDYQKDAIVYFKVIRNPDLIMWSGGISKIKKSVNITVDNGTATATGTAKTYWYNLKKNSKTGRYEKTKLKESTYTFTDSYSPVPKILLQPKKVTGIIYQYPDHFEMKVYEDGLQSVTYKVGSNESTHIFLVGVSNTTGNGVKFTEYSRLEYWKGDEINTGDWVEGSGKYDPKRVKVTGHGIYRDYDDIDFEIIKKELPDKLIAWWVYPEIILNLSLCFAIWFVYNRIKQM